ncbi:hypothetical protein Ddc_17652 [Ditylenchus destructor]|nr:hypothetical protein Ddc_17652 [Ditylenchus destructor]
MDAIHRHTLFIVIFDVLKFIPYENARNLLTTHKSWLAPLKTQLEKQRKAMTLEIERLEESYRTLRILQLQCKGVYVDLENQIRRDTWSLDRQICDHQSTIAPSLRHTQNVQSLNQTLQDLQNLRPAFDAASLKLSNVTAEVQALRQKINAMKKILGIVQEKSANERKLDELLKIKKYHKGRYKRLNLYLDLLNDFSNIQRKTVTPPQAGVVS